MPRQPRQILSGEYYHILARGNNRQWLFRESEDFECYLRMLLKYGHRCNVSIYHYCLMNNHVHLLMKSRQEPQGITRFMHGLQTAYAVYMRKRYDVTGHVFENRFKNYRIDNDSYLLECGRYIERNPVRAGMVKDAADYPWSSFAYYSQAKTDPILSSNPLYEALGNHPGERQESYRQYVMLPRAYEGIMDRFFDEHVLL